MIYKGNEDVNINNQQLSELEMQNKKAPMLVSQKMVTLVSICNQSKEMNLKENNLRKGLCSN